MKTLMALIFLAIVLLAGCRNREVRSSASEIVRVRVTAVTVEEISIPVHSTGMLVSTEELKLSFKTGGIVAQIKVKEGDHVRKGDLLASLDLAEVSAAVNQANAGYEKALRDYGRAEDLFRDSVATLEQKQNAASALRAAKSALEIAQFNMTHSKIVAPENGVILRQFVKQNELVLPFYPVFLFGSSGKQWKVKAGLSDKDLVKINPGDSAVISFDAYPGVLFKAVVDQVGEISNPYTGTFESEILLRDSGYRLASGFIAGVDIFPSLKKSYYMVPVGSIVEASGQTGNIFIITSGMKVHKVQVEIETLIGPKAAVKGIPEGTSEVVSEGAAYLKDGMKVMVVK